MAQVLDTFCNRPFKAKVKALFMNWTLEQLTAQIRAGVPPSETKLDLSLATLKPLSLEWAMAANEHLAELKEGIVNDYRKIGTIRAIEDHDYQIDCIQHGMYDAYTCLCLMYMFPYLLPLCLS